MLKLRKIKALGKDQDGSAIIEASVIIPFLVLLMVGVSGFGMAYKDLATAQKSLRSAGRYLARLPVSRLCSTASQDEAKKLAVYGNPSANTSTATPVISNWAVSNVTITLSPACPGTPSTTPVDRKITISATVPSNLLSWTNIFMQPSHEERWIGQ